MTPINYTALQTNPNEALMQGIKTGLTLETIQQERQAQQLAQQAAQQQQQASQLMQRVLSDPNATAADYGAISAINPKFTESIKAQWDRLDTSRQQQSLGDASKLFSALQAGRPDVALESVEMQLKAAENSGDAQRAQQFKAFRDMIQQAPDYARTILGSTIAATPGGDKYFTTLKTIGEEGRAQAKAPAELAKAQAEAKTKGIEAKYAEQGAVLDLEKKGWDIKKITADIEISKAANRIAAMNAATSRESNELKREELSLKVQDARQKLDDKIREKVSTAEAGATSIDNMLNTVQRIKGNKSLNDVLGSIEGRLPALVSDEANDAIALIETLGSQAFLAQIPNIKGMGALSNAEGEKLQSALTNLSRKQSEKQFRANLDEASRLLNKGREGLSKATGVPLGKPDVPAAPGARPPLSSFNR